MVYKKPKQILYQYKNYKYMKNWNIQLLHEWDIILYYDHNKDNNNNINNKNVNNDNNNNQIMMCKNTHLKNV